MGGYQNEERVSWIRYRRKVRKKRGFIGKRDVQQEQDKLYGKKEGGW